MKRALAALTTRGRAAVAAGCVAFVVAYGLGDRDLARLGLILAILPLLGGLAMARTRTRLASERRLTSARVAAGERIDVRIRIGNSSRFPSGVLLAEDTLPYAFGGRPRFVIDRLGAGAHVDVHYPVRCDLRGRYQLGPVTVRVRDPFGLSEVLKAFDDVDEVIVTPAITELPVMRLTGEWAGLGESTRRSVATAGDDDAATREYRLGDDLRRVHWRSTARRGELMVRREEQPWQSRAALLLDSRAAVHSGDGAASSLEWAISAAASIGSHLDGLGFQQRLVLDNGSAISGSTSTERFVDVMLDTLATLGPSRGGSLAPGLATLRQGGGEGLIVTIVAATDLADVEAMIRARGAGVTAVAIMIRAATWGTTGLRDQMEFDRAARLLSGAGWRVVVAENGSNLATVWQHAGLRIGSDAATANLAVAGGSPEVSSGAAR